MKISKFLALTACALFTFGTTFTVLSCADGSSSNDNNENQNGSVLTTAVSISATNLTIAATGTTSLTATLTPSNSTEAVTWTIEAGSDKATLSSASGKTVILIGKNTATSDADVTVKASSGSKSATKKITVKGKGVPVDPTEGLEKVSVFTGAKDLGWSGTSQLKIEASAFSRATSSTVIQFTYRSNSDTESYYNCKFMSGASELYAGNEKNCSIDRTSTSADDLHAVKITNKPSSTAQNFSYTPSESEWTAIKADGFTLIGFGMCITSVDIYVEEEQNNHPPAADDLPTTSLAMAKAMVIGWNLGNTLDADKTATKNNQGLKTETSWGMPATTKAMIDAVAAKGFKTIRVPVSWHTHITNGSNYAIDSEWMARVKTIVDWAYANDMYVILNVHHDDFTDADMANTYGYSISSNENIKTSSKAYLKAVWKQIAETFKEYDNRLVFEVLNEPRAIGTAYEWWENSPQTNVNAMSAVIKEYEQLCLNTIRGTGGKNATRFLMIPTYAANSDMATGWSMPTDTATDRLILSTHAYTPSEFALKGSATTYTTEVESAITSKFTNLNNTYIKKGIGVVIGEASVSNKGNDTQRAKWVAKYFGCSKQYGIPVVLWDNMTPYSSAMEENGEFHDWFNRNNCTWWHEDLINSMINLTK